MKYWQEEWIKEQGYLGNPNSMWASCGYCKTIYYMGQIGEPIRLRAVNSGGYVLNYTYESQPEDKMIHLLDRWLWEEHIPRCADAK